MSVAEIFARWLADDDAWDLAAYVATARSEARSAVNASARVVRPSPTAVETGLRAEVSAEPDPRELAAAAAREERTDDAWDHVWDQLAAMAAEGYDDASIKGASLATVGELARRCLDARTPASHGLRLPRLAAMLGRPEAELLALLRAAREAEGSAATASASQLRSVTLDAARGAA